MSAQIPDTNGLSILYDFVRDNSKGVSIALLFMLPLIFFLITFTASVGNYRLRKEFKTKYNIVPGSNVPHNQLESAETKTHETETPPLVNR